MTPAPVRGEFACKAEARVALADAGYREWQAPGSGDTLFYRAEDRDLVTVDRVALLEWRCRAVAWGERG